jgi:Tol biopolymer transport system component
VDIIGLAWSPDGSELAMLWSGYGTGGFELWPAPESTQKASNTASLQSNRLSWSPDGRFVVSGGLTIWSSITGQQQAKPSDNSYDVLWSPNGEYFMESFQGSIGVRNATSREVISQIQVQSSPVYAWSPDSKYIVLGSLNESNLVQVWDPFH